MGRAKVPPAHSFRIKIKSKEIMRDYVALHAYTDSPLKKKIPPHEIWIREDVAQDNEKFKRIKTHELIELNLMHKGMPYARAHEIASRFEKKVKT